MLKLIIPSKEYLNERDNTFVTVNGATIQLEHSLVSMSKWESKYHRPFLSEKEKTNEELLDYIKMMTITQNVPQTVYGNLTKENLIDINKYIENSMTATTFCEYNNKNNKPGKKEVITTELIYFWMVTYNIPFECQRWHLNRLLTLIKICIIKNDNRKMSKHETMASNRALNQARKQRK